ncbi:MAG TPA: threonine/serine dehydratase [Stellaceae bacterium]|nr:threonine/serine dehydratase [Stellaceae bacterium]
MAELPRYSASSSPLYADVAAAAETLAGRVVRTPLLEAPGFAARLGYRLFVKAESLQRTGSFKFRGALYRLLLLDATARRRGVVAYSSGNHAQGVACAAQLLGIPAAIVMPADAPAIKLANTRGYGAELVLYDRARDDREALGARLAAERGATLVKPYDDALVLAGQGTAALEAIEDAAGLGVTFDALAAPASGGGLIAGCALACEGRSPATRVYAAEPVGLDDHTRSLKEGKRVANPPEARSICDALQAATPGKVTFPINRRLLTGALAVTDDAVRAAMRAAFLELKLVLEPSGAAALAAALQGLVPGPNRAVGVIASGGNVDPASFAEVLRQ